MATLKAICSVNIIDYRPQFRQYCLRDLFDFLLLSKHSSMVFCHQVTNQLIRETKQQIVNDWKIFDKRSTIATSTERHNHPVDAIQKTQKYAGIACNRRRFD